MSSLKEIGHFASDYSPQNYYNACLYICTFLWHNLSGIRL